MDAHAIELQPAELVDRATEVERQPGVRPKPARAVEPAVPREVATDVRQRRPRDVLGYPTPLVILEHVTESGQEDVPVEIAPGRAVGRRQIRPADVIESAHVANEEV